MPRSAATVTGVLPVRSCAFGLAFASRSILTISMLPLSQAKCNAVRWDMRSGASVPPPAASAAFIATGSADRAASTMAGAASLGLVAGGGFIPGLRARLTSSASCGAFGESVITEILTELPLASHFFQSIASSCERAESVGMLTTTSGRTLVILNGTFSTLANFTVVGGASGEVGPSIMS